MLPVSRIGRLIFSALVVLCTAAQAAEFEEATHGPASLKLIHGVPVIHLYGTHAEMGEQYGALLKPQIKFLIKQYLDRVLTPAGIKIGLRKFVLKLSREMEKSIPKHYIQEMKALAKSAEVEYEDVLLVNTVFDIKRAIFCTAVVAVGDRSADKQPIFGRNLDFPTLGVAHKYSCVVVYHPKKGRAVASVTFPGMVGVLSGMNDVGVVAAVMEVHLRGWQLAATPYAMVFRTALTNASVTADVLQTIKKRARTSTNNLMICDAHGHAACAELGIRTVAVRRPKNGVIYSTNHFTSKELGIPWLCWRLPRIKKALKDGRKVDEELVRKILSDCAFNSLTMQSIVFRPASGQFWLAAGEPPATKHKFVLLTKSVLFPKKPDQ